MDFTLGKLPHLLIQMKTEEIHHNILTACDLFQDIPFFFFYKYSSLRIIDSYDMKLIVVPNIIILRSFNKKVE